VTYTSESGGLVATAALVIVFVASIIEFIAAARICDQLNYCQKEFAFAVAVGVASAFFTFAVLLYLRFASSLSPTLIKILAFLLFAMWVVGAGITTFRSPFSGSTGNGYFSAWTAFGASAYFLHANVAFVRAGVDKVFAHKTQDMVALWTVFFGSVIELTSAGVACDNLGTANCKKEYGWAVAVGTISLVICIVALLLGNKIGPLKFVLALLLLAVWVFGAGVLTFDNPFTATGNGYFSCWVAFFASVVWAYYVAGEKFPVLKRASMQ